MLLVTLETILALLAGTAAIVTFLCWAMPYLLCTTVEAAVVAKAAAELLVLSCAVLGWDGM